MHRQSCWNLWTMLGTSLIVLLILVMLSACTVPPTTPIVPSITSTVTDLPTLEQTVTPTQPPTMMMPTATQVAPTPTATMVPTATPVTPTPTVTTVPTETPAASAQYQLTFEATWSAVTHPIDFPPNPHFSGLIGASHSPVVRLWEEGETATAGIENMAEIGAKSPLDSEIDSLIDGGSACVTISGGGINPSPGVVTVMFTASQDCPVVSVVSMIAPSPDWFVGVSGLSLYGNGAWIEHKVVELFPYDAGTDSGSSYTSPDEPVDSPEMIRRIEVEPLLIDGSVPSLGTFTFSRLDN